MSTHTETRPTVPPVVYLPLRRGSDPAMPEVEIRRAPDGRGVLLAYTALDRLLDLCGPNQPWVLAHTAGLGDIKEVQHYDAIVLDVEVPLEARRDGAIA
ncbi:SAV_915 family protein [Serinibacter arcticus]|uniref:SseB protein N-terminal domain-containing protein n=1 Tax=Serinibacter arcticus TaxID=1655435 RepID=A0A4Z1E461_9MICO|nr:SAV_915 family protein [Serinibacter arcticus]TGO05263.1 hypothetical protein SERN_1267 [Serinibacter arcticus]